MNLEPLRNKPKGIAECSSIYILKCSIDLGLYSGLGKSNSVGNIQYNKPSLTTKK
jgi:hypothetical protein